MADKKKEITLENHIFFLLIWSTISTAIIYEKIGNIGIIISVILTMISVIFAYVWKYI
jgi:hypothetical protein